MLRMPWFDDPMRFSQDLLIAVCESVDEVVRLFGLLVSHDAGNAFKRDELKRRLVSQEEGQ